MSEFRFSAALVRFEGEDSGQEVSLFLYISDTTVRRRGQGGLGEGGYIYEGENVTADYTKLTSFWEDN